MAAVVGFWRLPEEEAEFVEFLTKSGNVVWVPWQKCRDKGDLTPRPISALSNSSVGCVLVGLVELIPRELPVNVFRDDEHVSYAVALPRLPMLTYTRGEWRGAGRLGGSDVSADWTVLDPAAGILNDQPSEFIKWGKRVMAWVRRSTPEWHRFKSYRVSQKVAHAIKHGDLEIVL